MTDYKNRPVDVQNGARDRIYWFFSLDYAGRRQYSEDTATNVYYEQMATRWGNWAKLFFNNKGVAAHGTDVCMNYPATTRRSGIGDFRAAHPCRRGLAAGALELRCCSRAFADPPPPPIRPVGRAVGDPVPEWAPRKPAEVWLGEPVVWTTGWGGRWCVWKNGQIITLSSNPVSNGG